MFPTFWLIMLEVKNMIYVGSTRILSLGYNLVLCMFCFFISAGN